MQKKGIYKETIKIVNDYLESKKQDIQSYLKTLVLIETPSGDPISQQSIFRVLQQKFKDINYKTVKMEGRHTGGYLYARPNTRKKNLPLQLLIGHCDTVWPIGTLGKMKFTTDHGKMSGPGVFDMKAGLTQILFALQTIHDLKLPLSVTPVILINSDEEIGSKESTGRIAQLAKFANRAFILEPPLGLLGKLKTARKGLGRFNILIKGKAAHAGLDPEGGASAIVELSHQVQQLFAMNNPEKGITVNVGLIEGGISPNVVAPESKAVIDVRVLNHQDANEITQKILALKPQNPKTTIEITGHFGRPPMVKNEANEKLWLLAKSIGEQMGLNLEDATAGGGSDGNTTSLYAPTLDGLGTSGDGAHASHEFIFAEKLLERTLLLTLLLLTKPL